MKKKENNVRQTVGHVEVQVLRVLEHVQHEVGGGPQPAVVAVQRRDVVGQGRGERQELFALFVECENELSAGDVYLVTHARLGAVAPDDQRGDLTLGRRRLEFRLPA